MQAFACRDVDLHANYVFVNVMNHSWIYACFFFINMEYIDIENEYWASHITGLKTKEKRIHSLGHIIKCLHIFRVMISLLNQLIVTAL